MHNQSMAAGAPRRKGRTGTILAMGAIACAVALGVALRVDDPLSSPVVPGEDPYTHMALVREHLRTGHLDALNTGENLYPPGLHGFLAAAWTYTGLDLYGIIQLGPVLFGALGILGIAVLLWRPAGRVAAFVGALAMAMGPEAIFRTTMMSPTALDLAILPFLFYALLRVMAGRLAWAGVAAPVALFLAFSHPWLLAILCAAGLAFMLFAWLFPWPVGRGEPISGKGVYCSMALLGTSLGVALSMPGFGAVFMPEGGFSWAALGIAVALVSLVPGTVAFLRRHHKPDKVRASRSRSLLQRSILSAGIAAILATAYFVSLSRGLPAYVDLTRMFGWPALVLAFAALVALPFIASPLANLVASLFAATFPLVAFNPLQSEFLPHRTAVFLGVALALLAGIAAGALVRSLAHLTRNHTNHTVANAAAPRVPRPFLLAFPAILVAALLGGAVYAGTAEAYPGGWYRLYNSCELDALRDIARQADAAPDAVVVVGDWQAKLVLAALTNDAERVWYKAEVYTSQGERDDLAAILDHNGRPLLVVMDRYLRVETPGAQTDLGDQWHSIGSWCAGMGVAQPRVAAYAFNGATP